MLRRVFLSLTTVALLGLKAMLPATEEKPYPPTKSEKIVEMLHGVDVADPYRWLEEGDNPAVKEWVEKQNQYTRSVLDKLPGREQIHQRLEKLLDIGDIGVPTPRKGRYFYTKREGKQNQDILYVRQGLEGTEQVLIDPNALAQDGTVALDWWFPSQDGKLVAYGLSKNGDEKSTLYVRDVDSGKDLPDVIDRTRFCRLAWLPDGKGFYYTRNPAPDSVPKGEENLHTHVFFHELGADVAEDEKVFGEGRRAEEMPEVGLSPDGQWLVVTEHRGGGTSKVFFKDRHKLDAKFVPLVGKIDAFFKVTPRNELFYVRTTEKAPRYKLYAVDPSDPGREHWIELLPESKEKVLKEVSVIGDVIVARYMHRAVSELELVRVKITKRNGKFVVRLETKPVSLPTLGSISGLGGEWDGKELFFSFESYTMPTRVFRVDLLKDDKLESWHRVEADIDFDKYEIKQVSYPSKDGTMISMFLTSKKGLVFEGKTPTMLYGYGGFNLNMMPLFSASPFVFLEQGGLIANPNLRGGGEYGGNWHYAGMLGKKQNTFDDFLSAAEWLISQKYTNKEKLCIRGSSNGGLLVGAALTQRPDLFRCVVCQVPVLDMIRYHKFLIGRLWISEFGSADNPKQFEWLYAYSPYHRVKDGVSYPAVLLTTAESDSRADPLHALKMTARLQEATGSDQPILLRQDAKAGHGAGKPRGKVLDELTDVWSFVCWQLGMKGM